eukprot:TRINITY_DN7105_c0_g1_i3.p1 TRINITY_DN7105_c0_g1~~TRINITY_DN7105_c0_g1_i3.p1  ORF type:complete len:170 (-),score=31.87 TRINITY_DN7105_c0_g1_i3:57-566(-)
MCIRDRYQRRVRGSLAGLMAQVAELPSNQRSDPAEQCPPPRLAMASPGNRFAQGDKVTPYHVKKLVGKGSPGTHTGCARDGWDFLKHAPGHSNTRPEFRQIGVRDERQTKYLPGFQRRTQEVIQDTDERRAAADRAVQRENRRDKQVEVKRAFIETLSLIHISEPTRPY